MNSSALAFVIVLLVVGIGVVPFLRGGVGGVPRLQARPLLTDREVQFWRLLRRAADPLQVAPQVAMGALLNVEGAAHDGAGGLRNRFDRKIVDFVLVDDDARVRLLVELDDRLHRRDRDAARDRMTARAGYRTLRISGVVARDFHLLRAAVDGALGNPVVWTPPEFNPAGAPRAARDRSARRNIPPA